MASPRVFVARPLALLAAALFLFVSLLIFAAQPGQAAAPVIGESTGVVAEPPPPVTQANAPESATLSSPTSTLQGDLLFFCLAKSG